MKICGINHNEVAFIDVDGCPVCLAVEEGDKKLAALKEKFDQLVETNAELRQQLGLD